MPAASSTAGSVTTPARPTCTTTTTFNPVADAYVSNASGQGNKNFGTATTFSCVASAGDLKTISSSIRRRSPPGRSAGRPCASSQRSPDPRASAPGPRRPRAGPRPGSSTAMPRPTVPNSRPRDRSALGPCPGHVSSAVTTAASSTSSSSARRRATDGTRAARRRASPTSSSRPSPCRPTRSSPRRRPA